MPFVSPMLFGSTEGFDAILTFGGQYDPAGGAIDPDFDPDTITVIKDPTGIFGSVQSAANYRYIEWATFGTYEFTVLQNYSSSTIDSDLQETGVIGGVVGTSQSIVNLTSGTTILSPTPVTKTITNNNQDDGLSVRMAAGSILRELVGTLKIGIKKV